MFFIVFKEKRETIKKVILSCMAVFLLLTGCATKASKDDYKITTAGLSASDQDGVSDLKAFIVVQNTKNEPIENVTIEVYLFRESNPERFLIHTFNHNFMRKEIKRFEKSVLQAFTDNGFKKEDVFNSEEDIDVKYEYKIIDEFGERVYLLEELI